VALLDRRAAHERIWYERLLHQFRAAGVPVQRLLLPINLELSPVASAILSDNLPFFLRHGLEVVEFGRHFYRIEALPSWMEPADADSFLRDVVDGLREGRLPAGDLDQARDVLAKMAAAKAVRIGTAQGEGDCVALVRELFSTTSPISSPSGRPTFVEFNHGELARRFQK
jgi:DNA mismatch repair protein MutL